MTPEEFLIDHIPHRLNLLITFRERFADNTKLCYINPQDARDLYRCAKDISLMMVRYILGELGLKLSDPKENNGIPDIKDSLKPSFPFIKRVLRTDLSSDESTKVLTVLVAANRAVAHVNPDYVNHKLKTDKDTLILFEVISFVERLVETNMYIPYQNQKINFQEVMNLPNNDMNRMPLRVAR